MLFKKSFLIIFLLFVFLFPFFYVFSNTVEELQIQISQKSNEIEKIEAQIKAYQKELNNLSKEKDSLSVQIRQLDLTKKKLNADISLTEKKITKAIFRIEELNGEIDVTEKEIDKKSEAISFGIRNVYQKEKESFVLQFLSQEKISNSWHEIENFVTLNDSLKNLIIENKNTKNILEIDKEETLVLKKELNDLKRSLADQKKIVEQNAKEKNNLLRQTKNSESNYQKLVKEQNAKKIAIEAEIRDFESKIKYILDPSKLPTGRVLAWPLQNIFVTQLFGRTVAAKRLYASGSHSGVDFRASVGTPLFSMADGVVLGVGDTDETCPGASFGKWVLIDFGNGLASTYGHLSLIKVEKGQKVLKGETIGYSGATGRVTGPHLHLTIYASNAVRVETIPSKSCVGKTLTQPMAPTNAYLDPMIYLPVYK